MKSAVQLLFLASSGCTSAWMSSSHQKFISSGGSPVATTALARSSSFLGMAGDSAAAAEVEEPKRNPNRPELPELKGDFDWDAKFRGDEDWITDNVPGKIVLNELELAGQASALDKLEDRWRKQREIREYEASQNVGFVEKAELINGRTAMFFLATGLLTEYWTGFSMPAQVEEMLRIGGFIGFD